MKSLILLCLFPLLVNAQPFHTPLQSDRVGRWLSANTLPKKTWQLETGIYGQVMLQQTTLHPQLSYIFPGNGLQAYKHSRVRYGVLPWLELRGGFDISYYRREYRLYDTYFYDSSIGPFYLGTKVSLLDLEHLGQLSLYADTRIPLNDWYSILDESQYTFQLLYSYSLYPGTTINVNGGLQKWREAETWQFAGAASVHHKVGQKAGVFGAYHVSYDVIEIYQHWLNTGVQWRPGINTQIDLSGGYRVNPYPSFPDIWQDFSLQVGLTWRISDNSQ